MPHKKNNRPVLILFILFVFGAAVVVTLLEYLDFKRGEPSLIFGKIFRIKTADQKIDEFNHAVVTIFRKNNIVFDYFQDQEMVYHFKAEMDVELFSGVFEMFEQAVKRIHGIIQLAEIQESREKRISLYRVQIEAVLTHLILLTQLKPLPSKEASVDETKKEPCIAFIMDDIGNRPGVSLELKQLNIPVTASILPDSPFAEEESRKIFEYKLEQLIHVPMQPMNTVRKYLPEYYVTIHSDAAQIRQLITRFRKKIPYARGANNHQGSLVTSDRETMNRFMSVLQAEGMFFVDSRTSTRTIAYDAAREIGLKTVSRDVFLDDPQTYDNSMAQIRRLVNLALEQGSALAIGHPFDTTFRALRDSIPFIKSRAIHIVFVSNLLN